MTAAGLAALPIQAAPLIHDQAVRVLFATGLAPLAGGAMTDRVPAGAPLPHQPRWP